MATPFLMLEAYSCDNCIGKKHWSSQSSGNGVVESAEEEKYKNHKASLHSMFWKINFNPL